MKELLITAVAIAASLPIVSAENKGSAADEAAIRAAVAQYNEARNRGDANAMAQFFTSDAQMIDNSATVRADGRAAMEKDFSTWLKEARMRDSHAEREVAHVQFLAPDLAVVTTKVMLTRNTDNAKLNMMDVDVMRKEGGKWLIASQHNLALREPTAAATRQKK